MSEYQYVVFQAVDGPLTDKQLEFARRQSSRADVTRWSLSCEYDYSSFRGDVDALLRGGYDVYLEYTNYGTRVIKLRLPHGMPFDKSVWSNYVDGERLIWKKDGKGSGGILALEPFYDSNDREHWWDARPYLDAAIRVRELLIGGDLRALYLLWLCAADDDNYDPAEMIEPPVPHGMAALRADCGDFLDFFGLDPFILDVSGKDLPEAPADDSRDRAAQWVDALNESAAKQLLLQLLLEDTPAEKARLLAEIRDSQVSTAWPTSVKGRSLEELWRESLQLREKEDAREARLAKAKAERERASRLNALRKDPDKWLRETEQLVEARSTANYETTADILKDLREAIGGAEGDKIALQQAANLVKQHPTLSRLKSALRKRGLWE